MANIHVPVLAANIAEIELSNPGSLPVPPAGTIVIAGTGATYAIMDLFRQTLQPGAPPALYSFSNLITAFDTSVCGAGATINSVSIVWKRKALSAGDNANLSLGWGAGSWAGGVPGAADAEETPETDAFFGAVSLIDGAVISCALSLPGNINVTGLSVLRWHCNTAQPGVNNVNEIGVYATGAFAPYLDIDYTPGGGCHVVVNEAAGAAPAQCPGTALNALCAVATEVWLPGDSAAWGTCFVQPNVAAAKQAGGAVSGEPSAVVLGVLGAFLANLPPQIATCPLDPQILQSAQTVRVSLPSGVAIDIVVPDSGTARLEKLLSGQVAALAPAHSLCLVSFTVPDAELSTVYVRLSAPAYWQRTGISSKLLDTSVIAVPLNASGLGSIDLPPQASMKGPSGAVLWWEFKLAGIEGWIRATVPDAASVAFEALPMEFVEW